MKKPEIDAQAVVATGAVVLGDVTIKILLQARLSWQ